MVKIQETIEGIPINNTSNNSGAQSDNTLGSIHAYSIISLLIGTVLVLLDAL
ncbi:hypothetical protein BACCIP111883_01298 [Sutcliffiella rhizosphaerae]|uniref:Uncharacterized protein n=1 Tax=Sutcliffiella rhizosphaerae TaxID=2880967 RepID=A0ABM8YKQ6_9BACI|nr:hypothetical protein BACCIP111883_01298 [Sutcliffiella rhizosphaerae]